MPRIRFRSSLAPGEVSTQLSRIIHGSAALPDGMPHESPAGGWWILGGEAELDVLGTGDYAVRCPAAIDDAIRTTIIALGGSIA